MATLKPLPYRLVEDVTPDTHLESIPISIEGIRTLIEDIVIEYTAPPSGV